ncbi:hypothetical protein BJX76DRAFT_332842 [Aspergillus varians]
MESTLSECMASILQSFLSFALLQFISSSFPIYPLIPGFIPFQKVYEYLYESRM